MADRLRPPPRGAVVLIYHRVGGGSAVELDLPVQQFSRQMEQLAFVSGYIGATNVPAVQLAEKLASLAYPSINHFFFTAGGGESNETAFKTARFFWITQGKPEKTKIISREKLIEFSYGVIYLDKPISRRTWTPTDNGFSDPAYREWQKMMIASELIEDHGDRYEPTERGWKFFTHWANQSKHAPTPPLDEDDLGDDKNPG